MLYLAAIALLSVGIVKIKQKKPVVRYSTVLQPSQVTVVCNKGCRRCYRCLDICPESASYVDEKGIPLTDMSKCRLCSRCLRACPSGARKMINTTENESQ